MNEKMTVHELVLGVFAHLYPMIYDHICACISKRERERETRRISPKVEAIWGLSRKP